MAITGTKSIIEQQFDIVKPSLHTQLPLFPDSMIHHKGLPPRIVGKTLLDIEEKGKRYGVSSSYRILSPGLFTKRFDRIGDFLQYNLRLTVCQRKVMLGLLRLYSYYGQVYPKAAQIVDEPLTDRMTAWRTEQGLPTRRHFPGGCSTATFWRTIRLMEAAGLITVCRRYLIRPHAQISNLYRFDKLLILIARYLAEHGAQFFEKWLKPYLSMPGSLFWRQWQTMGVEAIPLPPLPSYG